MSAFNFKLKPKVVSRSDAVISRVEQILRNQAVSEKLSGALVVDTNKVFVSLDANRRALKQFNELLSKQPGKGVVKRPD